MKPVLFSFAVVAVTQIALSQPHHQYFHDKRAVVTKVEYVTVADEAEPQVEVIVDSHGNPVSTITRNAGSAAQATEASENVIVTATKTEARATNVPAEPASAVGPASAPAVPNNAPEGASNGGAAPGNGHSSMTAAVSSAAPAEPAPQGGKQGGGSISPSGSGHGIVYSPYNADQSCKSQSQVNQDISKLSGYSMLRVYGVDCNQVSNVMNAAKTHNMKVMLGIYDIDSVAQEMPTLIAGVAGNWNNVHSITIGNEVVNSQGAGMVPKVVSAIGTARTLLKATPYTGPVATVDTFNALIAHPQLCQASDFAAANAHPFFDPSTSAAQAGSWLSGTVKNVAAACPGKQVVVTESGWPSHGQANGQAVPSTQNQQTALQAIQQAMPQNMFVLSAYNDMWKTPGAFGCEQYWGVLGNAPSS